MAARQRGSVAASAPGPPPKAPMPQGQSVPYRLTALALSRALAPRSSAVRRAAYRGVSHQGGGRGILIPQYDLEYSNTTVHY